MKKITQTTIAAVAGAALLLGGGSYALWNSTADSSTQANIQTGSSALTQVDAGAWATGSGFGGGVGAPAAVAIPDINAYRIVPGDTIHFAQKYLLDIDGSGSKTRVAFDFDDSAVGILALRARGIDFRTIVSDDTTKTWLAGTTDEKDTLNVTLTQSKVTPPGGRLLRLEVVVEFKSTATTDDLKLLSTVINNATITAGQIS